MRFFIPFAIALLFTNPSFAVQASKPEIQLANIYNQDQGIDLTKYLVSEKLDGVRAYFDGKNLISKEGNVFNSPEWFTKDFPPEIFEGELWIDKGKFELVSGTVRQKIPNDQDWQQVKLMLFDMPKHKGTFLERLKAMKSLVAKAHSQYLEVVEQSEISDQKTLMNRLYKVTKEGGEGLMIHKKSSLYIATRNDDLLKLKTFEDAEAMVLSYVKGEGKYQGMMGAILVENEEGIRFKIGGGFSVEQRKNPPPIGSIVTYKYFGKTKDNKPRFTSFLSLRPDYNFVKK